MSVYRNTQAYPMLTVRSALNRLMLGGFLTLLSLTALAFGAGLLVWLLLTDFYGAELVVGLAWGLFGALTLLLGLHYFSRGVWAAWKAFRLNTRGRVVLGQVADTWRGLNRNNVPQYCVAYTYQIPSLTGEPETHTRVDVVPLRVFARLKPGVPVKVRFLRRNPTIARIEL